MRNLGKNEPEFEESWNIKRIGLAFITLILLLGLAAYSLKEDSFLKGSKKETPKVLPVSDENLEDVVQKQIKSIREKAVNINVEEIASSSPQIQNLVNDIKALQELPKNQAKEACMNICKSF